MSMMTVGAIEVLYDEPGLVIVLDGGEYRGLIEETDNNFDFDHLVEVAGTLGLEVVSLCLPSVGLERKEETSDWPLTYWEGYIPSPQAIPTPLAMSSGMQYWSEYSTTDPTIGMTPGKLA